MCSRTTSRVLEQREAGLGHASVFAHALSHVPLRQDSGHHHDRRDARFDQLHGGDERGGHGSSGAFDVAHDERVRSPIGRILDFFKAEEREQVRRQLAATLQAVICQRMVNTVTGGVTPAVEIMINNGTVRKMIEENRIDKLPAAFETGAEEGMMNFNQSLFQLVRDGKVSRKEALAKATNAQALEMNFQGIFLDEGRLHSRIRQRRCRITSSARCTPASEPAARSGRNCAFHGCLGLPAPLLSALRPTLAALGPGE